MDKWKNIWMEEYMDGRMGGWMDQGINGSMEEWMDGIDGLRNE